MTHVWALAALWLALALAATLLTIWLRVATALSEIVTGAIAQVIVGAIVGAAVLGIGAGADRRSRRVPDFLGAKMATKFVGVFAMTRLFRSPRRESMYTTLLMSTGLTFGTISSLFGLSHRIITQAQRPAGRRRDRERRRADPDRQRVLSASSPAAGARSRDRPGAGRRFDPRGDRGADPLRG